MRRRRGRAVSTRPSGGRRPKAPVGPPCVGSRKADAGEPGALQERLEILLYQVPLIHRLAVLRREDQSMVPPLLVGRFALFRLRHEVVPKRLEHKGLQLDGPSAPCPLRLRKPPSSALHDLEGSRNANAPGAPIQVRPLQTELLAEPQARRDRQGKQRTISVLLARLQERSRLLRGQDAHLPLLLPGQVHLLRVEIRSFSELLSTYQRLTHFRPGPDGPFLDTSVPAHKTFTRIR